MIDESDLVIQDDLNGEAMARVLKILSGLCRSQRKMSKSSGGRDFGDQKPEKLVDEIAANTPFIMLINRKSSEKWIFGRDMRHWRLSWSTEVQIMDIKDELQQKVKERVDKHQKEYILREQLKLIRGVGDDSTLSDAEEFEKAAKNLKAPKEVNEKLKRNQQIQKLTEQSGRKRCDTDLY